MDFSLIDEVEQKLGLLFERINTLKTENRSLKQQIYSLKTNLEQARATTTGGDDMDHKFKQMVEERERLIMEREVVLHKVRAAMEKLDELSEEED
ncbi:MAG: hypothetical protein OEZ04_12380 [Nitrospinota bacterium]|nr:hypothetical protein [Nitrospinota bacterium]